MPRPMYLIEETLLTKLTDEHIIGVPVATLANKYGLLITPTTLSKMIKHKILYDSCKNAASKEVMRLSLFPIHLKLVGIMKQSNTHRYEGNFPLGKWVKI